MVGSAGREEDIVTFLVGDLFCGAGGSTSGAYRAAEAMGVDIDLVAVNHWNVAIATHSRNHPKARHACVDLDAARPEELVPEGRLDLLMASPECVFFSRARGGKPVSDQRRMSAWHVQRWCSALDIRCVLVENVSEFQDWGPLLENGRPDPARKGWYFRAWTQALTAMGYAIDWRLLNAANYGDATTRTRFFLQARKDGLPILWPDATHTPAGRGDFFGSTRPWRAAREVIDWTNPGASLLGRKRPLSLKTRLRIARGLQRFGGSLAAQYIRLLDLPAAEEAAFLAGCAGDGAAPFVVGNRSNNVPKAMEEPLPTFTTSTGGGVFLVEPTAEAFSLGQQSGSVARSVEEPLPTIATAGAISLIEPSLVSYYGGSDETTSVDRPLPTATTKARFGLCRPMVVKLYGTSSTASVEEPVPTVTAGGTHLGLCQPFIVPQFGEADGQAPRLHDIAAPLPAVTGHGAGALVQPLVLQMAQVGRDDNGMVRTAGQPLPTITAHNNTAVATPILVQFDQQSGSNGVRAVDDPLPTLTTKCGLAVAEPTLTPSGEDVDPRRLVEIDGQVYALDIRFRMLTNRELARAMGFEGYQFTGNVGEITRQIGNAVCVNLAAALVTAILGERAVSTETEGVA